MSKMGNQEEKRRSYLWAALHMKCPRCRRGNIFENKSSYYLKNLLGMHRNCPVCGQRTELEPGFYYGTAYVSYSLTVAFSAFTFVAWWVLFGFSTEDNRFFWWLGINGFLMLVLQPFLMRLSRSLWLSFFVSYNESWMAENEDKKNV